MRHELIDRRSLAYARIAVWLIDHDPEKKDWQRQKDFLKRLPVAVARNGTLYWLCRGKSFE